MKLMRHCYRIFNHSIIRILTVHNIYKSSDHPKHESQWELKGEFA
jgi:hypothetical protein